MLGASVLLRPQKQLINRIDVFSIRMIGVDILVLSIPSEQFYLLIGHAVKPLDVLSGEESTKYC